MSAAFARLPHTTIEPLARIGLVFFAFLFMPAPSSAQQGRNPPPPPVILDSEEVNPFAEFDVAISRLNDGRETDWRPLARSDYKLAMSIVQATGGNIKSLLSETNIRADVRSISLALALNPLVPDNGELAFGDHVALFNATNSQGEKLDGQFAVVPFSELWLATQNVGAPQLKILNGTTSNLAYRLQRGRDAYANTPWRDPESFSSAATAYEEANRAVLVFNSANQGTVPQSTGRLQRKIEELEKALGPRQSNKKALFVEGKYSPPAGTQTAPAAEACWLYVGVPGAPVPSRAFPIGMPILVTPSNLVVQVQSEAGDRLTSDKDGIIPKSDFDAVGNKTLVHSLRLNRPCAQGGR